MTKTTIEQVAEAIARQMAEDENDNLDLARAALLAIREPSEAVADAGRASMPAETEMTVENGRPFVRLKPPGECVSPSGPFTAIIDAILAEKPEAKA